MDHRECIAIGLDISKGRADIVIINQSGTVLSGSGGYDDTRSGHDQLSGVLRDLRRAHPEARLIAGLEATGGYERTWVAFFQRERHAGRGVACHRLNPLAVQRYLEADLHRKVDDRRAAQGIARYLLERLRESAPAAIPLDGLVVFYRNIRGLIDQRKVVRQRFLALLSAVHPELVQYCENGVPTWILRVCQQYPTAEVLARCQLTTLAAISHVGADKAQRLRAAAQESTAALSGPGTAAAMCLLVDEQLHLDDRIDTLQRSIITMMEDDPRVRLLDSIPGIAAWSAVALVLEIGDPVRFTDVRQLVAWAGLDPRVDVSGDGVIARGISHRGNAHLRTILFPLVMAAMHHNPIISAFVQRKIAEGKPKKVAMVAGAAKLLRIAYALLVTNKPYDAQHEANRAKPTADQRQTARAASTQTTAATVSSPAPTPDLTAPISAKERRRRRAQIATNATNAATTNAAATPSQACEVGPLKRDRRATAPPPSRNPT
jgi:transposase